jgi:hypothetical protein
MKFITGASLAFFISFIFLTGCNGNDEKIIIKELNTNNVEASGPYFTQDHKGNQVLCWTEQDSKDSIYALKYAIYNHDSNSFGPAVTVPASKGMKPSSESMGKVGFKDDGTIFAIYAKPFKNEKNRFAGAICYTFSTDNGVNWAKQRFLHSDTSHHYGRSFFDLAKLKSGGLGVIWLDGRFGKSIKGSSLFYASTEKEASFTNERCLAKGTCECCRTDILTDENGNIHVAYRSILFPNALLGEQVRDMVYSVSKDNGRTFSEPQLISKDNWKIDGCPHSGPTLAINSGSVNAVWFTAGGTPGLYRTSSPDLSSSFNHRTLLSSNGRHPQSISFDSKTLAIVYEESAETKHTANPGGSHNSMAGHQHNSPNARIVLTSLSNQNTIKTVSITDGKQPEHHAVLTRSKNELLLAWVRETKGRSRIVYSRIKSDESN